MMALEPLPDAALDAPPNDAEVPDAPASGLADITGDRGVLDDGAWSAPNAAVV